MGLKDKSTVVSVLVGVFLAAIAVAQIVYVLLSGNETIRIYLIASSLGIFVVLGVIAVRVMRNDEDVEEQHAALSNTTAKSCPDFWTRRWSPCTKNYLCNPSYTLRDGTQVKMTTDGAELNLAEWNQMGSPAERCTAVLSNSASYPFTDMVNKCNAFTRST